MSIEDLRFRIADEIEIAETICELQTLLAKLVSEGQIALVATAIAEKQSRVGDALMLKQAVDLVEECEKKSEEYTKETPRLYRLVEGLIAALERKNSTDFLGIQVVRYRETRTLIENYRRSIIGLAHTAQGHAGKRIIVPPGQDDNEPAAGKA